MLIDEQINFKAFIEVFSKSIDFGLSSGFKNVI